MRSKEKKQDVLHVDVQGPLVFSMGSFDCGNVPVDPGAQVFVLDQIDVQRLVVPALRQWKTILHAVVSTSWKCYG